MPVMYFGSGEVEIVVIYIFILFYQFAMSVPTTPSLHQPNKKMIYYCPPPNLCLATSKLEY